ncbi:mitochondrial outer membrane protein porin of 34 kDa [Senna tora]|uniref:Mitochondrial outer membrane protein porin of 34 kDa n=1 Tax=Senna tora TaxID=362788 RepID=A0A834SSP2_9FABA|nr:mitochondrial outer membrane protein porin of 34 kDa [Senna tora]
MAEGPVLHHDMDKKIRDLLYKDYTSGHKVIITSHTPSGLEITSSVAHKDDAFSVGYGTQLKNENITTNIKVGVDSNKILQHIISIIVDEPVPGLKAIFNYILPYNRYGKIELQYRNKYAAISTSLITTVNPIVNFSSLFGSKYFGLGIDISFDSASRNFIKHNAGLYWFANCINCTSSLTLNNKGDNLTGSIFHTNKKRTYAVGSEFCGNIYSQELTLTVGLQCVLNPQTLMKVRWNNHDKVNVLIHHDVNSRTRFIVSGEMKTMDIESDVKLGLALVLKS